MSTESTSKPEPTHVHGITTVPLPRVAIKFCVQCKWNLRAAYYAQELLQTFSLSLGEVALIPSTSGTFIITLCSLHSQQDEDDDGGNEPSPQVREHVLWDRKSDGGFPETKELKRRVRDLVEPGRGLGHVDQDYGVRERGEGKGKEIGGEVRGDEGGGRDLVGDGVSDGKGEAEGGKCEDCA